MTVYGYARVSTAGQSLNEQKETLKNSGAKIILSEKYSGTTTSRPQFEKLVNLIEPNDTLIVTKLDRFARNTREALNLIDDLLKEKIMIKVLNLGTIDNTPMGRMIVRTLLSVAEMERDMIIERTQAGKIFAKQHNPNYKEGRPKRQKIVVIQPFLNILKPTLLDLQQKHSAFPLEQSNTSKKCLIKACYVNIHWFSKYQLKHPTQNQ